MALSSIAKALMSQDGSIQKASRRSSSDTFSYPLPATPSLNSRNIWKNNRQRLGQQISYQIPISIADGQTA
jgi:hypothetical protein